MVPWNPSRMLLSTGLPTLSKTSSCVESISKMVSYMNDIYSERESLMMSCVFLLILCNLLALLASSLLLNGLNLQKTLIFPSGFFSIFIINSTG